MYLTKVDPVYYTLPILDTPQKIKFFAGERRYSH